MIIFEILFWISSFMIFYVYIGYPCIAYLISLFVRNSSKKAFIEPAVSIIISAYNEEKVISEKIQNTLELDYPKEKLEIIVASDGSSDNTDSIVKTFEEHGVKLYRFERMGKTGIQNESVKLAKGEILVFSDSNAMYHKEAIRMLVQNFKDPTIGCVCGRLDYITDNDSKQTFGEALYWRYEKQIKIIESKLSSLVGVNGSIYAVRKDDYIFINNDLISDFLEPLEIVKSGKRVIYEEKAVSEEIISDTYEIEFNRKIRIFIRSIKGILHAKDLLNPMKYKMFSFQFLSHKLFRYLVPLFLIIALVSLLVLSINLFYLGIYVIVVILLILACIGKFIQTNSKKILICNLAYYYLLMNCAMIIAWLRVIKGEKIVLWNTQRD